tara:strand:+ start:2159 stop:2386 length:228 start_codon:yes stop_codon:yes gene_type:complete
MFKNHLQRSAEANTAFSGHLVSKRLQKPFENGLKDSHGSPPARLYVYRHNPESLSDLSEVAAGEDYRAESTGLLS